jgi:nitrite reductase (NO-forming)
VGDRAPTTVSVELETMEVVGQLADGTAYTYWTFDGTVPGPMIRARVGDTVELSLSNAADSHNIHSIDLHAVNGPGGGATVTQVPVGESTTFSFEALKPGVYVYHCATDHIPSHIANGMYGMIVVEPEGGLPPVDREFYVMQGEIYTAQDRGAQGEVSYDGNAMIDEDATYVVFNGAVNALTGDHAMHANVGETVRLFVGNGGPNLVSSFHVIGEIFDRVHDQGASEASTNVQTTLIPAGGAAWVEFTLDVPGNYLLVDHSITRTIDKGALGMLVVEGDNDPSIFDGEFPETDPHAPAEGS